MRYDRDGRPEFLIEEPTYVTRQQLNDIVLWGSSNASMEVQNRNFRGAEEGVHLSAVTSASSGDEGAAIVGLVVLALVYKVIACVAGMVVVAADWVADVVMTVVMPVVWLLGVIGDASGHVLRLFI